MPFANTKDTVFWCTPCIHDPQEGSDGLVTLVYKLSSEQCFVNCWRYLEEKKLPIIFDLDHTLIHARDPHQTQDRNKKYKKGLQQIWVDEKSDMNKRKEEKIKANFNQESSRIINVK